MSDWIQWQWQKANCSGKLERLSATVYPQNCRLTLLLRSQLNSQLCYSAKFHKTWLNIWSIESQNPMDDSLGQSRAFCIHCLALTCVNSSSSSYKVTFTLIRVRVPSPGFGLRLVQASRVRVSIHGQLYKANSTRVYWQSPVKSNRENASRKSNNIPLHL